MIKQLFPKVVDNQFYGHSLAIWLFVPVTLTKLLGGFLSILQPGVNNAPTFSLLAAETVSDVAQRAFFEANSELILGFIFLVVLLRYRSLLPLMYSLLLSTLFLIETGAMGGSLVAFGPTVCKLISLACIAGFVLSIHADRPISQQFVGER